MKQIAPCHTSKPTKPPIVMFRPTNNSSRERMKEWETERMKRMCRIDGQKYYVLQQEYIFFFLLLSVINVMSYKCLYMCVLWVFICVCRVHERECTKQKLSALRMRQFLFFFLCCCCCWCGTSALAANNLEYWNECGTSASEMRGGWRMKSNRKSAVWPWVSW